MLALVLAAQLTVQMPPVPQVQLFRWPVQSRTAGVISALPSKACGAALGRLEVSLAQPTALYRQGDRPAKGLRRWVDYPDGQLCRVEDAR
jgi:hypothetical protein